MGEDLHGWMPEGDSLLVVTIAIAVQMYHANTERATVTMMLNVQVYMFVVLTTAKMVQEESTVAPLPATMTVTV